VKLKCDEMEAMVHAVGELQHMDPCKSLQVGCCAWGSVAEFRPSA